MQELSNILHKLAVQTLVLGFCASIIVYFCISFSSIELHKLDAQTLVFQLLQE